MIGTCSAGAASAGDWRKYGARRATLCAGVLDEEGKGEDGEDDGTMKRHIDTESRNKLATGEGCRPELLR